MCVVAEMRNEVVTTVKEKEVRIGGVVVGKMMALVQASAPIQAISKTTIPNSYSRLYYVRAYIIL